MAKYLRKPRRNLALRLAGVLFCLTLVSFYMVSGLFARYITSGQGSDSARVITFGDITLEEDGDFVSENSNEMWLIPGKDIAKDAEVTFTGSESATYVFVEVQVSDHWACTDGVFTMANGDVSWEIAEGWEKLSDTVFYRHLDPNETLTGVDIIEGGIITVSEDLLRGDVATLQTTAATNPIKIAFSASVVQSIGFDSVSDAWASLSRKEGA